MKTIILVIDTKSDVSFPVYGDTIEIARERLNSLNLNLEEFTLVETQDGKIFDLYIKDFEPCAQINFNHKEYLHQLLTIVRDKKLDPMGTHLKADKLLCDIIESLDSRFKPLIDVFKSTEKWYS